MLRTNTVLEESRPVLIPPGSSDSPLIGVQGLPQKRDPSTVLKCLRNATRSAAIFWQQFYHFAHRAGCCGIGRVVQTQVESQINASMYVFFVLNAILVLGNWQNKIQAFSSIVALILGVSSGPVSHSPAKLHRFCVSPGPVIFF